MINYMICIFASFLEICEAVKTFVNRNHLEIDIKRAKVPIKRTMVTYVRKVLESFPGISCLLALH